MLGQAWDDSNRRFAVALRWIRPVEFRGRDPVLGAAFGIGVAFGMSVALIAVVGAADGGADTAVGVAGIGGVAGLAALELPLLVVDGAVPGAARSCACTTVPSLRVYSRT